MALICIGLHIKGMPTCHKPLSGAGDSERSRRAQPICHLLMQAPLCS